MSFSRDPDDVQSAELNRITDFSGKRVLEIGCGDGQLTWSYAGDAAHVTGIDPSPEEIALARKNTPQQLSGRVNFITADIIDFTPADGDPLNDIALFGWSL